MRSPDLLIIGAARSSTSALARYLACQPSVFISEPKEPHFLAHANDPPKYAGPGDDFLMNSRIVHAPAEYARLFEAAPEGSLKGEGSVTTLAFPSPSIENIRRYCRDDVKLIACLRDPVERMFSSYMYLRSRERETITSFEDALEAEAHRTAENWHHMWRYRALSRYDELLQPFIDEFGREQVHVCVSERLDGVASDEFAAVGEFLGLNSIDTSIEFGRINGGGTIRKGLVPSVVGAVVRNEWILEAAKRLVPRSVQERMYGRVFDRPELEGNLRAELDAEFRPVVDYVEQLVGPLPEWGAPR